MVESPLKSILCVNRPMFASAQLDALSSLARVIFVEQLGRDQFKKDVRKLLDAGERFDGFLLFHRMGEHPRPVLAIDDSRLTPTLSSLRTSEAVPTRQRAFVRPGRGG
jgi:hypothetical protein